MPMYKKSVEAKLATFTRLLDLKESGHPIDSYYDRADWFAHHLQWMYKFKHIDRKTFDEYCDRVIKVFEIK